MDIFCTNCGGPLEQGDDFCKGCGEPVKVKAKLNFKPSFKLLVLGLSALVLVFLLFVVFNKDDDASNELFQYVYGDENYLYYNNSLIEIDEELYLIDYDKSFVFKNTAFLDLQGTIVLVDLKKHDYEVINNVEDYFVSKEEGKFAYLDKDEVILKDLTNFSKDFVVVEDVDKFMSNQSLTQFYVREDYDTLSIFDDKGKRVKEDILDDDFGRNYFVVGDKYLIYQGANVNIYDLESEKILESVKNGVLENVYASKNSDNFIVQTYDQAIVVSKDDVKTFDGANVFFTPTDTYDLTVIRNNGNDGSFLFNLEAMNGEVEYAEVELNVAVDVYNGFANFEYNSKDLEIYGFKKGQAKPDITKLELDEDISDLIAYSEKHFIYYSEDSIFYYNGIKEIELPYKADELMNYHFDDASGVYLVLDDEVHYMDTNGKTNLLFDEEDIWKTSYNPHNGELMILDEEDHLYAISKGGKLKLVADEVKDLVLSKNSMHFYHMDDALYAYSNGKSVLVGEDLRVSNSSY